MLDGCTFGNYVLPIIGHDDSDGAVETFFETVPDVSEGRHLLPASLECTGA